MVTYRGNGAPTKDRPGNIGDIYVDKLTGNKYECTNVVVDGKEHQFVTIHARKRHNVEYVWQGVQPQIVIPNDLKFGTYVDRTDGNMSSILLGSRPEIANRLVAMFDLSERTNLKYFFYGWTGLTEIPKLDTSNMTDLSYAFYSCSALPSVPEMDTSKVTNMSNMFYGCRSLTSVPEMDTSNVTDMSSMFTSCVLLTSVPEMDTSKVTRTAYIFSNCKALIEVPKLDMGAVLNQNYSMSMFNTCTNLTHLYLYNVRVPITIGSGTTYGHLLTVDSLVHTIKELCKVTTSTTLSMGSANLEKIADLYCRVLDDTTEKIEMELCESTDEGAMTLAEYAALKNWTFA